MTGRIKKFSSAEGTGTIETDDGNELLFRVSDVLAFDRIGLRTGKVVGFVQEGRHPRQAFAIFICSGLAGYVVHDRSKPGENLRYAGFRYENGLRLYAFEERTTGEETRKYLIETEVDLLLAQKVSLQETPALCLAVLHCHLESGLIPVEQRVVRLRLTEADIRRFAVRKALPKQNPYGAPRRHRPVETGPHLDHSVNEGNARDSEFRRT